MSGVLKKMFSNEESLFLDSLYCDEEEECWDNGEVIQNQTDSVEEEGGGDSGELCCDEELRCLLKRETEIDGFVDGGWFSARAAAVDWILGVVGYYSFCPETAVLAVNYLDRFLCMFGACKEKKKKPWTMQLAAVACLSLAAKVEETHVPLLLDLQVESQYVFEAKTIQRMEILVLSTLQWKMNPVTPLSFLHCVSKQIGFKGFLLRDFLRRCESLLFSLLSDWRFMSSMPSALATATMLYVLRSFEPSIAEDCHAQLIGILGIINKDKVEECYSVIQEAATMKLKRKFHGPVSESPTGVVDVCFFNSDKESWPVEGTNPTTVSPPHKRIKPPIQFE